MPTLATLLHERGYHTAAFVASFILRRSAGLARGFDVYNDRFRGAGRAHLTLSSLERSASEVAREAAGWLKNAPHPFFLWVHFYDPHAPYEPPPAFASRFPGRAYDAEVAASDFGVSTVLEALPSDRRSDTLIIATGDHGEGLGEHGESEHGILLYDSTLHVPLVMQGPGVPAGTRVKSQVRHVDIVPTVLDLLGRPRSPDLDGVSVTALFAHDRSPADAPVSYAESRFGELHFGWSAIRSARDGVWKYIDAPRPELYQLPDDPGERTNRQNDRAAAAAGLSRAINDIVGRAVHTSVAARTRADVTERLRSLGYVSGTVALNEQAGRDGDPKDEIARYEQYVAAFNDALRRLEEGRAREAEPRFRALAKQFPRSFEAHQYLARSLSALGAFREAIAEFDLAIALNPAQADVYFDAARTLAEAGQFDQAFSRVAEARRLEPASFEGALTEGLVARAAGQSDRAEQKFREAIDLNAHSSVAHFELGRLAEARGDRQSARSEYESAIEADPTLTYARTALERLSK
jgi:tetratricopeptide (TPR) repeat protein